MRCWWIVSLVNILLLNIWEDDFFYVCGAGILWKRIPWVLQHGVNHWQRSPPTNVAWVRFRPGAICGLSLLLVVALQRGFSPPGHSGFPLFTKTKTNLTHDRFVSRSFLSFHFHSRGVLLKVNAVPPILPPFLGIPLFKSNWNVYIIGHSEIQRGTGASFEL